MTISLKLPRIAASTLLATLLALLANAPAAAAEATRGGAANATSQTPRPGFACGTGMSWTMDGGVAKCKVPDASSMPGAPCSAQVGYVAGQCTFDLPAAGHAVTVSANNTRVGWSGALSVTCNNGTWGVPTYGCNQLPTITVSVAPASATQGTPVVMTWSTTGATAASYSCSGAANYSGALATSGSQSKATPTVGTVNCTAVATGPGGSSAPFPFSWTVTAPAPSGCPAGTVNGKICSYPFPALAANTSGGPYANTTPGYTGAVALDCSPSGVLSIASQTCDPLPPGSCPAGNTTSGACNYSVGVLNNGQSQSVSNATAGYTGQATATCNSGTLNWSGKTCAPAGADCGGGSTSSGACTYSVGALGNGTSQVVANATAGYTGQATATCSAGTLSWSGQSCAAGGASNCGATTYSDGSCTYSVPATPHGNTATANVSGPAGYTGYIYAGCNNGAYSYWGNTCIAPAPGNCAGTSTTYSACSYSVGALVSGQSQSASNATPGFTGQATGTCSSGVVSWSGQSCAPQSTGCAATTTSSGACQFAVGGMDSGANATVSTYTPGYNGQITASCNSGTISWSGPSCAPIAASNCAATATTYSACSYSVGALNNGQSQAVNNGTAGYTGQATATCSGSAVTWSGQGCAPAPSGCTAATTTYSACSYSVGALSSGQSQAVNNGTAGYTGQATATCSGSAVTWSGQSCSPAPADCAAAPGYATGSGCMYNIPAMPHGGTASASNVRAGWTGVLAGTCSNGSWTGVSETCQVVLPLDCPAAIKVLGACTYGVPATAHGAISVAGAAAPAGYTGSVNATCNNGTFSYGANSCNPPALTPCNVGGVLVAHGTMLVHSSVAVQKGSSIGGTSFTYYSNDRCYKPFAKPWTGAGSEYSCEGGTLVNLGAQWGCSGGLVDGPDGAWDWVYL